MDQNDTIEVRDFNSFLAGLSAFLKMIINYVVITIRRRVLLFLALFVALAAFSGWHYYKQPYVYKGEMVFMVHGMAHKVTGEEIEQLETLVASRSYNQLGALLHLPTDKVNSIVTIEGRNMVGSQLYEDFTPDQSPVYITIASTSNKDFGDIQNGVLNYLNKNSTWQLRRIVDEDRSRRQKIDFLQRDLTQADSTIAAYNAHLRNAGTLSDTTNIIHLLAYKDKLEDRITWETTTHQSELQNTYEVIHGLVPPDKPAAPPIASLFKLLLISLISAFVFVALVDLFTNKNLSSSAKIPSLQ